MYGMWFLRGAYLVPTYGFGFEISTLRVASLVPHCLLDPLTVTHVFLWCLYSGNSCSTFYAPYAISKQVTEMDLLLVSASRNGRTPLKSYGFACPPLSRLFPTDHKSTLIGSLWGSCHSGSRRHSPSPRSSVP